MLNRTLLLALVGLIVGILPVDAQTTQSKVKGRIIAARVQGQVNAVSKMDGQSRVLHDGDQFADQTEVVTLKGASVVLVFSNGATLDLAPDSTLDVEEFEQDPFASDIKVSSLKQEPGTSVTRLNMAKGELVAKVVHLNVDRGSEFLVSTPVGAAGIRGTTFRIVFRPDPGTGKAYFVVTTTEGAVVFKGVTSGPVSIPAGRQVVATFDYTAPTATSPASTVQSTPVTITTSNVSAAETSQIEATSQSIVSAVESTVIPSSASGASGNGGQASTTTTTPSTQPAPVIQPINPTVVSPSH